MDSVLRYVHFNADNLLASYRAKIERAKSLSAKNRETYLAELAEGLKGYTYFRGLKQFPTGCALFQGARLKPCVIQARYTGTRSTTPT